MSALRAEFHKSLRQWFGGRAMGSQRAFLSIACSSMVTYS